MLCEVQGVPDQVNALALAIGVIIGASLGTRRHLARQRRSSCRRSAGPGGVDFARPQDGARDERGRRGGRDRLGPRSSTRVIVFSWSTLRRLPDQQAVHQGGPPAGPTVEETCPTRGCDAIDATKRQACAGAISAAGSARRGAGVAAQDAGHRRDAARPAERRRHRRVGRIPVEVDPEHVLPRPLAARARLELAHVEAVLGEDAQHGQQRARARCGPRRRASSARCAGGSTQRRRGRVRRPARGSASGCRAGRRSRRPGPRARTARRPAATGRRRRRARRASTIALPAPAVL